MRKYAEFYQQAGPCPTGISKQFEWLAYKDGQCLIFPTKDEALGFSKLTECRCKNESEVLDRTRDMKRHKQGIYDAWYNDLRLSQSSIPTEVFGLFYQQACMMDADNQYGHDAIADYLIELVDFFNIVYSKWQ